MSSKLKDAIAQYMMIPMGMGLYYSLVWQYAWKPLFRKSKYQGEIGSSDMDDPFTQEEKIGYVAEEAREPNTNQKERERQRQDDRSDRQYEQDYRNYMQERDEKYIDKYQDYPSFYT